MILVLFKKIVYIFDNMSEAIRFMDYWKQEGIDTELVTYVDKR